jgi:hypothetical protein
MRKKSGKRNTAKGNPPAQEQAAAGVALREPKHMMERMQAKFSRLFLARSDSWKAQLITALIIGAVLAAAAALFLPLRFASTDDAAMMRIASGLYTDQPDEHLVFQNVFIGLLLKTLYTVAADVPWYPLFLIGVQFLSITALLFALLIRRSGFFSLFLFTLFFALLQTPILMQLGFATTAFSAALAGVVLVLSADTVEIRQHRNFLLAAGIFLLITAGLIHGKAALLAGVFALPLIVSVSKKNRVLAWSAIGVSALLIIFLFRVHQWYYAHDADWSAFLEHHRARLQVQDHRALAITDAARLHFAHVDWDETDVRLFDLFFQHDEQVYSTANLQYLAQHLPKTSAFGPNIHEAGSVLWSNKWAVAMAAGLIVLTLRVVDRRRRIILLSTTAVCAGAFFCAGFTDMRPPLIANALILFGSWTAVWLLCSAENAPRLRDVWLWTLDKVPVSAISTILVILALLQAYWVVDQAHGNAVRNRSFERFITRLVDRGSGNVYVSFAAGVPAADMSPFFRLRRLREFEFVPDGWLIGSPVYHAALKRLAIDSVNQALVERPNNYLIVNEKLYNDANDCLLKFFLRHYDRKVILPQLARVYQARICRVLASL